MSTPADVLSRMIEALTEERSGSRRRTHANTAHVALRQLLEAQPPATANEAEQRGFRAGLLRSIDLARQARNEHEARIERAEHLAGAGYVALNGVRHYGQAISSTFESLALNAALKGMGEEDA